jgi:PHD/YefM family antitoxin component YafN of YafNO toxin-antitoxin module
MEASLALPFIELRKNVAVGELQRRFDEIIDDLDANLGTVYHVVDEQDRRFVLMSKEHYDFLARTEAVSAITTPSNPSDILQT